MPRWTIYAIIVLLVLILLALVVGLVVPEFDRREMQRQQTADFETAWFYWAETENALSTVTVHIQQTATYEDRLTATRIADIEERQTSESRRFTRATLRAATSDAIRDAAFTGTAEQRIVVETARAVQATYQGTSVPEMNMTASVEGIIRTYSYIQTLQRTVDYNIFQYSPTPRGDYQSP